MSVTLNLTPDEWATANDEAHEIVGLTMNQIVHDSDIADAVKTSAMSAQLAADDRPMCAVVAELVNIFNRGAGEYRDKPHARTGVAAMLASIACACVVECHHGYHEAVAHLSNFWQNNQLGPIAWFDHLVDGGLGLAVYIKAKPVTEPRALAAVADRDPRVLSYRQRRNIILDAVLEALDEIDVNYEPREGNAHAVCGTEAVNRPRLVALGGDL